MQKLLNYGETGYITATIQKISNKSFQKMIYIALLILCSIHPLNMGMALIFDYRNYGIFYILQVVASATCLMILLFYFLNKGMTVGKIYFYDTYKKLISEYKWIIFLVLFLIWETICSLRMNDIYKAFFGNPRRSEGIVGRIFYISVFACAILLNKESKLKVMKCFAISGSLLCLQHIIDKSPKLLALLKPIYHPFEEFDGGGYISVFEHHNHYGYYLCMVILCVAGLIMMSQSIWQILIYVAMMAINIWALLLCNTFGSFLGVLLALFIISVLSCINRRKLYMKAFVPLVVFFVIMSCTETGRDFTKENFGVLFYDVENIAENNEEAPKAGTGRWQLWKQAMEFIEKSPIFGYGEDGIEDLYEAAGFVQDRPANEYLEYAAYFGIPGLILYVLFLIGLFINRLRNIGHLDMITMAAGGIAISYAVSACFGNTAYYTTVYFFLFLGMVSDCRLDNKGKCEDKITG